MKQATIQTHGVNVFLFGGGAFRNVVMSNGHVRAIAGPRRRRTR